MKAKGKVIEEKGKYFVMVGTQKHELIPNEFGGVSTFKTLVGKDVEAILTDPNLVGILAGPGRCFVCYVQPPDFKGIVEIDPAIRTSLLEGFVKAGLIDANAAKRLGQSNTNMAINS